MKKRYHYTLGFPKGLKTKFGVIPITYTKNAQNAAQDENFGSMVLPSTINTTTAHCIEAEINERVVTKLVYRLKYNHEIDMTLVLNRDCSVRALWFNKRGEKRAINPDMFTIPEKESK